MDKKATLNTPEAIAGIKWIYDLVYTAKASPSVQQLGGDPANPQDAMFVAGTGVAILDGEESVVGPDRLVHVPAGARHNVENRGDTDLRLFTIYAPPQHVPGTVHRTKADADADEADHAAAPA